MFTDMCTMQICVYLHVHWLQWIYSYVHIYLFITTLIILLFTVYTATAVCIFTCKLKILVNSEYTTTTTIIAGVYTATSLLLKTLVTEVYCGFTAMK